MASPGTNNDFDLESAFDNDESLETLLGSEAKPSAVAHEPEPAPLADPFAADIPSSEPAVDKKRSSKDFELDMEAILLTAQSSLIIEGIRYYGSKDFGPHTLPVYKEALGGIELYIKLIDRNPNNYKKLKRIIDTDIDCQKVENTVFNLFRKLYHQPPETDPEKVIAFEKFRQLFASAVDKAAISVSIKLVRKYSLLSGGIDEAKILSGIQRNDPELKSDLADMHRNVQIAIEMVNKGDFEIVKGLRGKDLNAFIINTTSLLAFYFARAGNQQAAAHYERVHNNFKKYFITK